MGISNTTGMVVAALVGGSVGALLLLFAYFVGIALVGAGLGALVAHVGVERRRHAAIRRRSRSSCCRCSARSARWCCSAT